MVAFKLLEPTTRNRFKCRVEDVLRQVRGLKPGLQVWWIKGHSELVGIASDLDTVGCMIVIYCASSYRMRTPYDAIDLAVYNLSLRECIASWEANDGRTGRAAAYPDCIIQGCERLGWIVDSDDDDEGY